jgi:hypothetical protein
MISRPPLSVLVANVLVAWIVTALIVPNNVSAQDEAPNPVTEASTIRLAKFDVDATPTVGSMMAYDSVKRVEEMTLRARGIVLLGADDPIVLCAVDWIGIGNEGHDQFRSRLAAAAGTTPERVAVHTLHQHDAPRCDFTAERLVNEAGKSDLGPYDSSLAREVLKRLSDAVKEGINGATEVTHAGWGSAEVKDVASNRRLQDETGKVIATRYTACRDPKMIAAPVGTIDPELTSLTFFNGDKALAVITHYACHPQSYYRTGVPSPDFPGLARFIRGQARPNVLHVHFNGAGGNIGAGKYNDGSPANRMRLAHRVADAMEEAADNTTKFAITTDDIDWTFTPVSLPPAPHLDADTLRQKLGDWNTTDYWGSPDDLAWLLRCQNGHKVELSCLSIADVRLLHMPGELFVEYQLAAKAMRPDLKIAMAAYGDYGPGYIGTEEAYGQGGYETSQRASKVAPEVETVLMDGVRELLEVNAEESVEESTVETDTSSSVEVETR